MPSDIIIVGAGMIGVCTALHLQARGQQVLLIDKNLPGRETSYGNAGVIQCEAVMPASMPRWLKAMWRIALMQGMDVHYHLRDLPRFLPAVARYWVNSEPTRHAKISIAYNQLIKHALSEHDALIKASQAEDLIDKKGYLWLFRSEAALAAEQQKAEFLAREYGVPHEVLTPDALKAIEPAVHSVAGAIHWTAPWSCRSPGDLVSRYAALFVARGGQIIQAEVNNLTRVGEGWQVAADVLHSAKEVVLATGPWSGDWGKRLGYLMPFFVKRGYHQHYTGGATLTRPVLDAERGYVLAPMLKGTRLTTGAELAARDAAPTPKQLGLTSAAARELLTLGAPLAEAPWLGARPCTADMLPIIGPAPRHPGLWFNFGHAHQGFTLGPVSGRLLAEQMTKQIPIIDGTPYDMVRFDTR